MSKWACLGLLLCFSGMTQVSYAFEGHGEPQRLIRRLNIAEWNEAIRIVQESAEAGNPIPLPYEFAQHGPWSFTIEQNSITQCYQQVTYNQGQEVARQDHISLSEFLNQHHSQ